MSCTPTAPACGDREDTRRPQVGDPGRMKHLALPRRGWRMKQEALPLASGAAPASGREVVASDGAPIDG